MRVQCVALDLPDSAHPYSGNASYLMVGKEYLVFGLRFERDPQNQRTLLVTIFPNVGYIVSFPLALFTITDPRVSRYWEARSNAHGSVGLYPASFYASPVDAEEWFGDRYLTALIDDDDPAIVADFVRISAMLENE